MNHVWLREFELHLTTNKPRRNDADRSLQMLMHDPSDDIPLSDKLVLTCSTHRINAAIHMGKSLTSPAKTKPRQVVNNDGPLFGMLPTLNSFAESELRKSHLGRPNSAPSFSKRHFGKSLPKRKSPNNKSKSQRCHSNSCRSNSVSKMLSSPLENSSHLVTPMKESLPDVQHCDSIEDSTDVLRVKRTRHAAKLWVNLIRELRMSAVDVVYSDIVAFLRFWRHHPNRSAEPITRYLCCVLGIKPSTEAAERSLYQELFPLLKFLREVR